MRTVKFLALSAVLLTAVPALAQGGLQPRAFPRVDRFARLEVRRIQARRIEERRIEARRIERRQLRRHIAANRNVRLRMATRFGLRVGARAALRAGRTRGMRANATPAVRAFRQQLRSQRQAIRAQVRDGTLTREQAHTQMRRWITEHRPNK